MMTSLITSRQYEKWSRKQGEGGMKRGRRKEKENKQIFPGNKNFLILISAM